MVATNDEPTDPLEPTKNPSLLDFLTSLWAIKYIGSNPAPITPPNAFLTAFSKSSSESSSSEVSLIYLPV